MVGARRWYVALVGSIVAVLGVLALRTVRTFESTWDPDAGRSGIDTALLIDTRGAPLVQTGDRGNGLPANGGAAAGYVLRISALADRSSPMSLRLVAPSGETTWSADLAAAERGHLSSIELVEAGVWRVELTAPGEVGEVSVRGAFEDPPWSRTPTGWVLPIAWILAGLAVAIAVWLGTGGARIAGYVLAGVAVVWPYALASTFWIFHDSPGERALAAITLAVTASAGLALGWTRPHPDGPPPHRSEVVWGVLGAVATVAGLAYGIDRYLCSHACRGYIPSFAGLAPALLALAGLLVLAVCAWRVGRRTAETATGSARIVLLDTIGTVAALASGPALGVGLFAAWFTGYGIGFADQGPDPDAAVRILVVTLVLTMVLLAVAIGSFRLDGTHPRHGAHA